jgi:predicted nucleic acid-binding protein
MTAVVDSCGWISWLAADRNADAWAPHLSDPNSVIVPTIVLCEVVRWMQRERGEAMALVVAGHLQQCRVAPLEAHVALLAASLGLQHRLAMADALVYAHARSEDAVLLTTDAHFDGLPGVEFIARGQP